jgi:SAM-dependent methyltransferase
MSFGAIAEDYDRLRTGPPDAAVDWLVPAGCRVAVDLGAGTGLLTRALAARVPQVVAVEPDPRMAAVLRARASAGGFAGIRVAQGRGEAIPLPDASADGVFASSSWHWLDPERAPREVARVLRDGGRLGVIWTGRDRHVDWVREVELIRDDAVRAADSDPVRADGGSQSTAASGGPVRAADGTDGTWARRRFQVGLLDGLFGGVESESFSFSRRMTVDDFVGLLATYSGAITASPQEVEAALTRAKSVLERRFPGAAEIDVPMRSLCFRSGRLPR